MASVTRDWIVFSREWSVDVVTPLKLIWGGMVGLYFLVQYQGTYVDFFQVLITCIFAFLFCWSLVGFGAQIMMTSDDKRWDNCFVIGLLGWGSLLLPLVLLIGIQWTLVLLPIVLFYGWKNREMVAWPSVSEEKWPLIGAGLLILVWTLYPTIDTDALYYHVALPKQIWMQDQLLGGELRPNGSRPMLLHLPLSQIFALAGEKAVNVFSGLISIAFVVSLVERSNYVRQGSGWIVLFCLFGSYSFWEQSTITANNMMAGFVVWLAFWASIQKSRVEVWGALMGFAVAVKYTSLGVIGAIWLLSNRNWLEKWKAAGIAGIVASIWLVRNGLQGVHPFFPYTGWEIEVPFVFVEKYGVGRDFTSMILLPWNLIMNAQIDQFQFLGRLSPLFLLLLPFAIWKSLYHSKGRRLLGICTIAFVFWALGPHWIRHLFPFIGLLVFGLSIAIRWDSLINKVIIVFVFALGIPANVIPVLEKGAHTIQTQAEDDIPGYSAMVWINQHTSQDTKVALFFAWSGLILEREYVLGSVEDHTPARHWIMSHQKNCLRKLKENGIDYLVVGPHKFIRKSYSFLTEEEYRIQFQDPIDFFDDLLFQEARLVQVVDGYSIYQLP
jgi:hypothetical protein